MTDRLVFLHGFTQTGSSWHPVTDLLERVTADSVSASQCPERAHADTSESPPEDGHDVLCPDLPGHGTSARLSFDLPTAARWLGDIAGRATYVGYSMGGRLALHLAVARPKLVERLVLVSTTAGIASEAERAARRAADEERAREIERDGVAAFLDRWLALPLFANLSTAQTQLDDRLANTVAGLASSLRLAGTGAQEPLWARLSELPMPTLVIAGQLDVKFAALAEQLAATIPKAELAIVPGAGHVVHLERPDEFADLLTSWLARTPTIPM